MKFQKLTRLGFEYRIYAEDGSGIYPIHGAVKIAGVWSIMIWMRDGTANTFNDYGYNLLPEKKRRFKTNEELINSGYAEVLFKPGVIIVQVAAGVGGTAYRRYLTETIEQYAHQGWLDVFTVEEDSI